MINNKRASSGLTWFFALIIIVLILILFIVSFTGLFVTKGIQVTDFLGSRTTVLTSSSFFLNGLQGQRTLFYFLNSPIYDNSLLDFIRGNNMNSPNDMSGNNNVFKEKFYEDFSTLFFEKVSSGKKIPLYLIFDTFGAGILNCSDTLPGPINYGLNRVEKISFGETVASLSGPSIYFSPGQELFGYGLNLSRLNSKLNFGLYYKYGVCE